MLDVHELDLEIENPATTVWISDRAEKELRKLTRGSNEFFTKLEDCCTRGFQHFLDGAVRREPGGTWRFGITKCMARMAGFFEDEGTMKDFVVPRVFKKKGKKNTTAENRIYETVAAVRDSREWRRAQ